MHGYYWDYSCPVESVGLLNNGWTVFAMGLGLIAVVGIVLWFVWSRTATRAAGTPSFSVPLSDTSPTGSDAAEAIARERFARGEIDRDEFDKVIAALRSR